ncbi:hypothetical protein HD806DRAFT_495149 [Xylariaceae sp. AK1471]|nr:hypothetical protein HD806DRAFT_495149 [Xylariaceae sp. AK1471]
MTVYISLGRALLSPYPISSVPNVQQCTLCADNETIIENGRLFSKDELHYFFY